MIPPFADGLNLELETTTRAIVDLGPITGTANFGEQLSFCSSNAVPMPTAIIKRFSITKDSAFSTAPFWGNARSDKSYDQGQVVSGQQ